VARRSPPIPGYHRLPGHRYSTPGGGNISENAYRSLKAQRAGFRNYANQRRVRESDDFRRLSHSIRSHTPGADLSSGGEIEREITALIHHRESVQGGGDRGSGHMIGEPGERFKRLLARLGAEDWLLWRFWYSEVTVG
jgi:hypothetical protein